jgi:prefoldin subunit 5
MGKKKKEVITLDERISNLKKQQEDVKDLFMEIRGAIKVLEQIKSDDNEKTD